MRICEPTDTIVYQKYICNTELAMYIKKKLLFSLFSFLLFIAGGVSCQPYYFRQYSVEDGLSNSTLFTCLKDKKGFIWMGTKDGLNGFDVILLEHFVLILMIL